MNENIAPSEVTDNVGDERGDAFRAIPTIVAWILLEYYDEKNYYDKKTPLIYDDYNYYESGFGRVLTLDNN